MTLMAIMGVQHQVQGQESGEPIIKIFGNYHQGIAESVREESAFEILRAYLGYNYSWNNGWKAQVKLDIGSPDDLSEYSLIRRYAYFKNAYLSYKNERIELGAGLVDMENVKVPENYWSHRYIMKEFQDEYKLGPSADIGIYAKYKVSPWLGADFFIVNGEGYNNLQRDNVYRYGMGLNFYPAGDWIFRIHYDLAPREVIEHNASVFLGYRIDNKITLGAQAVYNMNANFSPDKDIYGFSFFGLYDISEKIEVFGRYDILRSGLDTETHVPWNLIKDGSALVFGAQYTVTSFFKFSLNYQDWFSLAQNGQNISYLYLNMEVAL